MSIELLSPAGSPESLRAAVESGAGAVYLGYGSYNARRSAANFTEEEFKEALAFCHARGVRVFLTLNILLTDRELPEALETARQACREGADAVLVQDWGLLDLLRKALPDLPLHASTQMSIFTSGGAEEAASDGCERVVIARECTKEETAEICRNCPAEIEVFIHGALCMCYSGQCGMSALIGGRSGNRGRCAQPCRLPYGVNAPAKDRRPLSLKDSCLSDRLQEMEEIGVACGKIEGRMRRPGYVRTVTGIYAKLLNEGRKPSKKERQALEEAFSRSGFTEGYWLGRTGPEMFGFRPEGETSGRKEEAKTAVLTTTPAIQVKFVCRVIAGEPSTLTAEDEKGRRVTVTGPVPEAARTRELTPEELTARLKKTGGTGYECVEVKAETGAGLSLPASAINGLRRRALEALAEARRERREMEAPPMPEDLCARKGKPALTVSLTETGQLTERLLSERPARIYLPLEKLNELDTLPDGPEWCAILPRIWRDRDETELKSMLLRVKKQGVMSALAGNIGHLPLLRDSGLKVYGDYGLNLFNSRSLGFMRDKGLAGACVSYELRFAQIRDLRKPLPIEAIVYGRLPLMITENCIIKTGTGECRCEMRNELWDRTGALFPMLPAYGHRTEIENSRALWLADRTDWHRLGLSCGRLRFTTESGLECAEIFHKYKENVENGKHAEPPRDFTRGLYLRGVE